MADRDDYFAWTSPDQFEITPSPDSQRYILVAAAASAIRKNASKDVQYMLDQGYLTGGLGITEKGESKLRELLALTEEQDDQRFILGLAAMRAIEISSPKVQQFVADGLIDRETLVITAKGQDHLARLSGIEVPKAE